MTTPAKPAVSPAVSPPGRAPGIYQRGQLRYEIRGLRVTPLSDLYHYLMRSPWSTLLGVFVFIYCGANALFALGYWLGGPGTVQNSSGSFAEAFWFSVQTFATIGYGNLAPASTFAHVLVTIESFCGMLSVALGTGILFAKFSKPMAKVAFSAHAVVTRRNGQPCLMWRVANRRSNALLDATVQAHVLMDELSAEGTRMRRAHELKVERGSMPMFLLAWTVIHPIDQDSPLYGLTAENATERFVSLIASFSGVDDAMVQTVHARQIYTPEQVKFGVRFADMLETGPGKLIIDHSQLDELRPEADTVGKPEGSS